MIKASKIVNNEFLDTDVSVSLWYIITCGKCLMHVGDKLVFVPGDSDTVSAVSVKCTRASYKRILKLMGV